MSDLAIHGGTPIRQIPFPDYPVLGDAEIEAVTAAVRTQNLCAQMGETAAAFEREFAHGFADGEFAHGRRTDK